MKFSLKTTLTLLIGVALGTVGTAVADGGFRKVKLDWSMIDESRPELGFATTLLERDQMKLVPQGKDNLVAVKLESGQFCSVKIPHGVGFTLLTMTPSESYAVTIGPGDGTVDVGWHGPDVPPPVVLH